MKKIFSMMISALMAITLSLAVSGCKAKTEPAPEKPADETAAETTPAQDVPKDHPAH